MKTFRTVCPRDCYDTCCLRVTIDDTGRIRSIRGDPDHPVTRGMNCPRGAADAKRRTINRIDGPHVKSADTHRKQDWSATLDDVAQKLATTLDRFGPGAVLHLEYAGNIGLLARALPKRVWNAIGATQTDGGVCSKSGNTALGLHYGAPYGQQPDAVRQNKLIVFWGMNAAVSFPHLWHLARRAQKRNEARIAVVDPHRNKTAQTADLHLQPRPGTDVALAYGLLNVLIQNGLTDETFIRKWTRGFDRLKAAVSGWDLTRTAAASGIGADQLMQLGNWYAKRKPSVTNIGIGLQKNDRGADQVRAVSFIPAVLGLHRGFFYGNGTSRHIDSDRITGKSLTDKKIKIVPQVAVPDLIKAGQFKFVYISGMNPAVTLPNARAFRDGMARRDVFSVVQDSHWTMTARMADALLPVPAYLEKDDLVIPWTHRYVHFSPKLVEPAVDCRSEGSIMRGIARRLKLGQAWLFEEPWVAVESALAGAFEGGRPADLKMGETLKLKLKTLKDYPTPSGRIEFVSQRAAAAGFEPLPEARIPDANDPGFVLLTSATAKYTHSQFQEVYGPIPAVVEINPRDADALGLSEGQAVVLENQQGTVTATAVITDRVRPGVLWCPRQFVDGSARPQNDLMSSLPQSIGSGPRFNSTRVNLRPVTA
jgi:anaerobic selenocysteine-containing dehydrogenase